MQRSILVALPLGLMVAAAAWADIPLPSNLQYVDPRVQFDGLDKHGDYVFYLRFLTFSGSPANVPHRLVEVKDAKPFPLGAQRRLDDVSLIAMKRGEFDERVKKDGRPMGKDAWLNPKTPGVLSVPIAAPDTVAPARTVEAPITPFRVSIQNGKLSVEAIKKDKGRSALTPDRTPDLAVGVFLAMAFISFGLWLARRRG